jgi:hypothetical protein
MEDIKNMQSIADRTCQRVKIQKGLSYNGLDIHNNIVDRCMGVALNVSQNGIQIETDSMILTEHVLLMFYDYKSNFISSKGKVIYSQEDESGKFKTGIQLMGVNGDNHKFVKQLIQSYHYQKKVPIFVS